MAYVKKNKCDFILGDAIWFNKELTMKNTDRRLAKWGELTEKWYFGENDFGVGQRQWGARSPCCPPRCGSSSRGKRLPAASSAGTARTPSPRRSRRYPLLSAKSQIAQFL